MVFFEDVSLRLLSCFIFGKFCGCVVGDFLRLIYIDLHFEKLILFVVFFLVRSEVSLTECQEKERFF